MSAFVRILSGSDNKAEYPLNRAQESLIGRGSECYIQINDPRASRAHAKFVFLQDGCHLFDLGSRNGTTVNGSKIDSALLMDGAKICIGDTELLYTEAGLDEQATVDINKTDMPIVLGEYSDLASLEFKEYGVQAFESLRSAGREKELSALHAFTLQCNGLSTEQELVEVAMALLSDRTRADAVAFLHSNEFGGLDLAGQLSSNSDYKPPISDQLTDLVTRQKRAVWVQHETMQTSSFPQDDLRKKPGFADAICVPLIDKGNTLGAIHLYSARRKFERSNFDFAIAVASGLAVSLVRVLSAQSMQVELGRLQDKNAAFDELIGDSQGMTELKQRISRIARASGCILIRGEGGAGKELVARAIHRNSQRAARPMLSVNCAAIPDELIESQLFGHVKGAFTGADRDHVGYFQQANKGTLFLDEVGELNLEGQAKLLRILEGHPFLPVGATKEITVDVRVLSATNRDLREFVAEK
ncbi:MAG: sigma 54-interacting transcriptional regulator, partial [Pirellula sp.]